MTVITDVMAVVAFDGKYGRIYYRKNGAYEIRTHDLHNANVARSQLR